LAALRGGLKTVLIPKENEKDLAEIPENVKAGLEIIPVSNADEVIRHALIQAVSPIEWSESESQPKAASAPSDLDNVTTH